MVKNLNRCTLYILLLCSIAWAIGCSKARQYPERVVWAFDTQRDVDASPAVVDGRVYIGSDSKKLYCLDATTGDSIWEFKAGGVMRSSPAVAGGYVYAGSHDHKIYCLKALDGSKVWEFETKGTVVSSPAVANGFVYIGSYDNRVYC
ncbi:MAG: PQQ-like beta-propeller repeat protein, partial [Proteobacteria bacterium]|nr:PQQ-like beta-propeller repeat protein [Pseudomonadota bacterium]